jgi:hypothetical protein
VQVGTVASQHMIQVAARCLGGIAGSRAADVAGANISDRLMLKPSPCCCDASGCLPMHSVWTNVLSFRCMQAISADCGGFVAFNEEDLCAPPPSPASVPEPSPPAPPAPHADSYSCFIVTQIYVAKPINGNCHS